MFNTTGMGYSLSDVAAVTGNNRNGAVGDDWAWIIILLLCGWGNGGFGFGGLGSSLGGMSSGGLQQMGNMGQMARQYEKI